MRFRGIYAPLATPFDHRGRIYWSKFDHNLAQLRRTKLSGFVVAGEWGEGPLLSFDEKVALWKRAAQGAGEGAAVIAAIDAGGVSVAREAVAAAAAAGCRAAILQPPALKRLAPSMATADLFYRSVADAAEIPVLARLDPGVSVEALSKLARHPRIAGASVGGADLVEVRRAAALGGPDFAVLAQDLASAATSLAAGASAAVLALATVVPFFALSIEEAVRTREHDAAAGLTARALEFDSLLQAHGVPALKVALDRRSAYGGRPRLPLLSLPPEEEEAVSRSLYELAS